jgi:hypothetical protein
MNKNKTWEVNTTKLYETHDLIVNGKIIELFTYYKVCAESPLL